MALCGCGLSEIPVGQCKLAVSESFIQILGPGFLAVLSGCKEIQLVRKKNLFGKSHQHLENLFRSIMDFESYKTMSFSFFQVSILLMQYKN